MKPSKYYNGDELLSRHFQVNMVCGERAGGKSWWAKKYVLKRTIRDHDHQFALIVRDVQQLIGATVNTYFDDIMTLYPEFEITLKKGNYMMKNKHTGEKWVAGHVFALKHAPIIKSASYPKIETVIFEEFCPVDGKYLKNEFLLFETLMSTILRGIGVKFKKNAKILMIANNYSANVPYFSEWGLLEQITEDCYKRFYYNKERNVILERTDNLESCKSDFGSDRGNAGKWVDFRNQLHLVKNPNIKKNKISYQLTFDGKNFFNVSRYNDSLLFWKAEKYMGKDIPCFSCSEFKRFNVYDMDYFKKLEGYKVLYNLYLTNTLIYDGMEAYIALTNIFSV